MKNLKDTLINESQQFTWHFTTEQVLGIYGLLSYCDADVKFEEIANVLGIHPYIFDDMVEDFGDTIKEEILSKNDEYKEKLKSEGNIVKMITKLVK